MSVVGAGSLQTVTAFPGGETRLEIGATTVSVDFGDSEFSATDAAADFPLLAGDEDWENWQRVGAASGLTRIYAGIGDATALLTAGATATFPASGELLVRIDANGLGGGRSRSRRRDFDADMRGKKRKQPHFLGGGRELQRRDNPRRGGRCERRFDGDGVAVELRHSDIGDGALHDYRDIHGGRGFAKNADTPLFDRPLTPPSATLRDNG